MEYDLPTIHESMELPSPEDIPGFKAEWLNNPKNLFLNATVSNLARTSNQLEGTNHGVFRNRATCEFLDNPPVDVFGEGTSRKDAEKAAYLHLLAKLYRGGYLKQILGTSVDRKTMAEEKGAKLDIYNYAARHGCVPKFELSEVGRKGTKKGSRIFEVKIELSEQNIKVSGVSRTPVMAEVAAALNFKSAAEEYHAKQGTEMLVVKDSSTLGVANAKSFFDFCRIHRLEYRASVQSSNTSRAGSNMTTTQVMVNGEPIGEPVTMIRQKEAEDVAHLVAAIEVIRKEPELLTGFQKALKQYGGRIVPPPPSIELPVSQTLLDLMDGAVQEARRAGLRDEFEELESEEEMEERRSLRRPVLGPVAQEVQSQRLQKRLEAFETSPELANLRQKKAELPMNQHSRDVLSLLEENNFSIVIGATGSGKTTQVPQIILDDAIRKGDGANCNIICTQPRRIAATSVGRRVADERDQRLQESVGYHVRHDPKLPQPGGSINYCTTGILLQQLQHSPDEMLDSVSHLIIDEVHERDILIDFLLIIVKKVISERSAQGRSCPKVVLMSATMDSDLFSSYFADSVVAPDGSVSQCPTLRVPGRLFPVTEKYLDSIVEEMTAAHGRHQLIPMQNEIDTQPYLENEKDFALRNPVQSNTGNQDALQDDTIIDWKRQHMTSNDGGASISTESEDARVPTSLIAATIAHIAKTTDEGAILTFLPGLEEIVTVQDVLSKNRIFGVDTNNTSKYRTFLLHSSVADSQRTVFEPVPPGCRKIILATNIAETSVTIPDVQYVVDTGKLREKRYDQLTRITKLQCTWVSKSNAKQRAGRAGRVQNGHYYGLFTESRKEALRAVGLPEILRSDLQKVCLDVKAQKFKAPVREFLADAIEPPSPAAVDLSVNNLMDLNCLTEDERLTALGRLLASLPVHPSLGKMIVLGVIFRCLDPMLVISAGAEERDMFINPLENRAAAQAARKKFVYDSESDHIAYLDAFRKLRFISESSAPQAQYDFARRNFLHLGAYKSIANAAQQIEQVFCEAGLIPEIRPSERVDFQYGDPDLNVNSNHIGLIKALTLAGLHPNIAVRSNPMLLRAPKEPNVLFHPGSVNAPLKKRAAEDDNQVSWRNPQLFTYGVMAKSNDGRNMFLRTTSRVSPLMAGLFGGRLEAGARGTRNARTLEVDGWLPLRVEPGWVSARGVMAFRRALERMQTDAFGDLSTGEPLADHPVREIFANEIIRILDEAERTSSDDVLRELRARGPGRRDDRWDDRDSRRAPPPGGDYYRPESHYERAYG